MRPGTRGSTGTPLRTVYRCFDASPLRASAESTPRRSSSAGWRRSPSPPAARRRRRRPWSSWHRASRITHQMSTAARSEENTPELQSPYVIHYAVFFFNYAATTEIYTLSLHDALPISCSTSSSTSTVVLMASSITHHASDVNGCLRSEEHTSELQSPYVISYAVFCLKK